MARTRPADRFEDLVRAAARTIVASGGVRRPQMAEVEPFKTAIVLRFVREWPFVLFALALLAAGLFIERFYCRYLCALGAALAIPARMRMFEWLKRYRQCGTPCQICANECMVQAIHPDGHINPNECLYCLNCQQLYYDDHRCPVMIQQRERRERQAARGSKNAGAEIAKILTSVSFEVRTEIRFIPNDEKLKPEVRNRVRVGKSKSSEPEQAESAEEPAEEPGLEEESESAPERKPNRRWVRKKPED